jgi:hypothetical protein
MLTCNVKFKTHAVSITVQDDGRINCFKHTHNNEVCDYETFTNKELASEYVIAPFPSAKWVVELSS